MDEDNNDRDYIALFEDNRAIAITANALLAWCRDGHGWTNFLRGIFDPDYAPEMYVHLPKHGRQTIKVVPAKGFKAGATFNDPFKGRTKPG